MSQIATTFYNAMFWGGYRDVAHKVHSFYFPRYPEGIEATINWPDVDLVFRNDTPGYVLIVADYTSTSVTVEFYGDNHGRIVVGDWKDGRGSMTVVSEGGSEARVVTADVSDRYDEVDPPNPLTRGNPDLSHDDVNLVQSAREGWDCAGYTYYRPGRAEDHPEMDGLVRTSTADHRGSPVRAVRLLSGAGGTARSYRSAPWRDRRSAPVRWTGGFVEGLAGPGNFGGHDLGGRPAADQWPCRLSVD